MRDSLRGALAVAVLIAMGACTPGPTDARDERADAGSVSVAGLDELLAGVTSFTFDAASTQKRALEMEERYEEELGSNIEYFDRRIVDVAKGRFTEVQTTILIWSPDAAPTVGERRGIVAEAIGMSPGEGSLSGRTVYRAAKQPIEYVGLFPVDNVMMVFQAPASLDLDPWKLGLDRVVLLILDESAVISGRPPVPAGTLAKAAKATTDASTGRYATTMRMFGARDLPSGPVMRIFGTYDVEERFSDVRYIVGSAGRVGSRIPAATRARPHMRLMFKGLRGYVSSPASDNAGWDRLFLQQAIKRLGAGAVSGFGSLAIPPLLDILQSPGGIGAIVEHERGGTSATTYLATLQGRKTVRLFSVGALARLVKRFGVDRARELFELQVPLSVTVDQRGFIRKGWIDLSPLMRRLGRAWAPRSERDDVPPVSVRSEWTFKDVGTPVDITFPPQGAEEDRVAANTDAMNPA